jgi:PAS domain S-box-containing protein
MHLYESDDGLAARVSEFLAAGLARGDGALVIATELHRQLLARRLQEAGVDVEAARAAGCLAMFDAEETLAKLMVGAMPDPAAFNSVVGRLVGDRAGRAGGGAGTRAYGGMVDLLLRAGNDAAAVRLQELWRDLARAHRLEIVWGSAQSAQSAIEGLGRERLRARRAGALQAATARLAAALTEDEVATALLAVAEELLGAAAGVVYLEAPDGQLRQRAAWGVPSTVQRWRVLPRDAPVPLTAAIAERRALLISTREELLARYPNLGGPSSPAAHLEAVAALPLVHGARVVGGFAVGFDRQRQFDAEERRWLDGLAAQAAVAAERARLYEAERRAREEAETLFRIGEALSATQPDLESILQRVTDEATKLTGAEFGAFFYNVVDRQGEAYLLYTLAGAPKEAFARLGMPRNTPLFAATFAGEGVVRLDDVTKDPRYGQMGPHHGMPPGHLPVRSYLAVPVVARNDRVLGGLFFGHSQLARFTAEHERVTKSLAATAALAIDNASLFKTACDAEESQRRLVGELRETVRLNELFVGVLAHDLRSPLTAVLSAGELLQLREAKVEGSKNGKAIARLLASGRRMRRMIDQLLDFTRLRVAGGLTLEPRPADIGALVRQVADEVDGGGGVGSFGSIEVDQSGDGSGRWDGDRLAQIFSNLLANALQHGNSDDGVRVFVDGTAADTVEVRVHNMGAIPADLQDKVFDAMTTSGGEGRSEQPRGLGLGLFIAKQLTQAHGGDVRVESSEAAGTTFTVSLPRFVEGAAVAVPPPAAPSSAAPRDLLQDAEPRFRLLVEAVRDYAIFMLDPGGHVATWNVGAKRIKGYDAGEIIGQHFSKFYPEEVARSGRCERELEIAALEGRFEDEGWRIRKDGSRFWANVVITALRKPSGELVGFTKVTRDLTERRRLEQEQIRLARAEEAIRLRDEFLSLASHELKTPLTVLQMQLDTLRDRLDAADHKVSAKLRRATQSSERLASLVESLLDVSRIASGRFALERKEFDLADSIGRLVDTFRPVAEKVGCSLTMRAEGTFVGAWDQLRVEQAVTNLLSNAIKYGAGAPVNVDLRREADDVLLEVRDHGPGIQDSEIVRIFGRFERAASVRNYGGLGLGLYLIQEIVDAHGGTVSVCNAAGGGACFQLRLPVNALAAGAVFETSPSETN